MTNINGKDNWNTCFIVPDVDLPTGYYLGMSAATGDLAGNTNTEQLHVYMSHGTYFPSPDNHDIISVRVYDMETPGADAMDQV